MDSSWRILINCNKHGHTQPAILCSHLVKDGYELKNKLGWVQAEYDPSNIEPGDLMAWCNDCDEIYENEGGWNDNNDDHFSVVCQHCFLEIQEIQQ